MSVDKNKSNVEQTEPAPRKRMKREDRDREIAAAAVAFFAEVGFDGEIQLSWTKDFLELQVGFYGDGTYSFYAKNHKLDDTISADNIPVNIIIPIESILTEYICKINSFLLIFFLKILLIISDCLVVLVSIVCVIDFSKKFKSNLFNLNIFILLSVSNEYIILFEICCFIYFIYYYL